MSCQRHICARQADRSGRGERRLRMLRQGRRQPHIADICPQGTRLQRVRPVIGSKARAVAFHGKRCVRRRYGDPFSDLDNPAAQSCPDLGDRGARQPGDILKTDAASLFIRQCAGQRRYVSKLGGLEGRQPQRLASLDRCSRRIEDKGASQSLLR